MKKTIVTALALFSTLFYTLWGQTENSGAVIYSLPNTNLHLTAEALCEEYTPGIYGEYAKKFLGLDVPLAPKTNYTLMGLKMVPMIEADLTKQFVADLSGFEGKSAPISFFKMTSQGVVILSDENKGGSEYWRFPSLAHFDIDPSQATENLTSTETILYRQVKNENGGYDKVATTHSQVVEKSLEKKAQEAASTILSLRAKRIEIITGDTDATFSGEALQAAVEQIDKLEEELMALFIGRVESHIQKMTFDVIPTNTNEQEIIIAFRFSETQGLLQSDEISGRPIVMEVIPQYEVQEGEDATEVTVNEPYIKKGAKNLKEAQNRGNIEYRIPSICTVKLFDADILLLQSRVPVYQKGEQVSFPLSILVK